MLPAKYLEKFEQEQEKVKRIDLASGVIQSMLEQNNIDSYNNLTKRLNYEDVLDYLHETYVDAKTFDSISIEVVKEVIMSITHASKDRYGNYKIEDFHVIEYRIILSSREGENIKVFNYKQGENYDE